MPFELKNKNVIFLLNSPELGGAERQALFLAGYLQNELNCNVFIYCCIVKTPSKNFKQKVQEYNLESINCVKNPLVASRRLRSLKVRFKLLRFGLGLRKHNPDVIIPYLNKQSIIAAYCKSISGAEITFWNNRGSEIYRNDYFERKAVSKTKLFLINSSDSKIDIKKHLKVSDKKIYFLPNFLTLKNEDTFIPKCKNELTIGMLAHFRSEKLHLLLLKSFVELVKYFPDIKLQLVGSFAEKEVKNEIDNYIAQEKIGEKVKILSNSSGEKTIPYFDIAVLVSLKEGMSNSLMEYMYFKKPIVCSKLSGNEYLLGKNNQFLVENDISALVEVLKILINDEALRISEGRKNHYRIINRFGIHSYIKKLEMLINDNYLSTKM